MVKRLAKGEDLSDCDEDGRVGKVNSSDETENIV
jgi:hypothetical protein